MFLGILYKSSSRKNSQTSITSLTQVMRIRARPPSGRRAKEGKPQMTLEMMQHCYECHVDTYGNIKSVTSLYGLGVLTTTLLLINI